MAPAWWLVTTTASWNAARSTSGGRWGRRKRPGYPRYHPDRARQEGRAIAIATASGQVWLWDPSCKPWTSKAVPPQGPITDLVGGPNGWVVALGTSVVIVDAEPDRVWRAESLGSTVTTDDLRPDSMWLVASTQDCQVRAWDGSGAMRLETPSTERLEPGRFHSHRALSRRRRWDLPALEGNGSGLSRRIRNAAAPVRQRKIRAELPTPDVRRSGDSAFHRPTGYPADGARVFLPQSRLSNPDGPGTTK